MDKLDNGKALITFSIASLSLVLDLARPFIIAMVVFMVIDYVTGLAKALYLKQLDSKIATAGLFKKSLFLLLAFTGWAIDLFFNIPFSVGTIISTWIILTEIISTFENLVASDVPIPKTIVKYFKRFRDDLDKEVPSDEDN